MYTVFNFCGDKFLLESNAETGCCAIRILINFLRAVIIWQIGRNNTLLFPLQPKMMYGKRAVLQKYAPFVKVTRLLKVNNVATHVFFFALLFYGYK
jgi:hypothetical protein